MRVLAHIFSILAFILSSLLTVQLLTSRAEGIVALMMMGMLGLIAEGGKGLLFYHGVGQAKNSRLIPALASLSVAVFLIFLSILGTVSALNLTEQKARTAEAQITLKSQSAQSMLARASELRAEADELPEIYRTGKIRRRNEAWELEKKAQEILGAEYMRSADQFERIAAFLHISPAQAQMLVFWGYGFALELIACLLAIIGLSGTVQVKKSPLMPILGRKNKEKAEDDVKIQALNSNGPFATPKPDQKKAPAELRDLAKKYFENAMQGERLLGYNKSGLTRTQWEKVVRALGADQMIGKDHLGFKCLKSQEEMWAWVA